MELDVQAVQALKESVFGAQPIKVAEAAPVVDTADTAVVTPTTETSPTTATVAQPEAASTAGEPVVSRVEDAPAASQYDTWIKEKFGLDNEAALAEALSASKAPQTAAEIAFANDESKRIHALLQAGKVKEVLQYYGAQEQLSNLDGMTPEQQLKLYIKMNNPLFDNELIEDEYNSNYSLDEDAFADDSLKLRKEKVKLEQRKANDLAKAQEYFSAYKTKIELPNINAAPAKDEAYESYKAQMVESQKAAQKNADSYAKLSPKAIESKYRFNDEANKLDFTVSFEPDKDSFSNTIELLTDPEKLEANYRLQDGSPDTLKFARDLYNGRNIDKIVANAMKQAAMETMKSFLSKEKNLGDTSQRAYNTGPQTDVQNLKKQVFGK